MQQDNNKKKICILGSTGSIGVQALQVIEAHDDLFEAYVLTANSQADLLISQARRYRPAAVVIADEGRYDYVREALADEPVQVYAGAEALCQVVKMDAVDIVLTALVGFAGLRPTISAIESGETAAFATKETREVAPPCGSVACRQRAQCHLPVPDGRVGPSRETDTHGIGRSLPPSHPGTTPDRHTSHGAQAPQLGDGGQDYHRQCQHDEQGI